MALQGPFVVVADSPAPDVVEACAPPGAFPVVEASWADAPAALASVEPEAVVLADACGDPDAWRGASSARWPTGSRRRDGTFMPVIARIARRRRRVGCRTRWR